jgi:hypothetical protein
MPITATIQNIVAVDQTINVDVTYDDGKGGVVRKLLNFQNGEALTQQAVRDEITRQAITKAKVGLTESDLKALIGQVIIADEKTPVPVTAVAVDAEALAPVKGG